MILFRQQNIKKITLILSVILFCISLTQDCFCTTKECWGSLSTFFYGIFGLFTGGVALTWLANPILFASWIIMFVNNKSIKLPLIGGLISTMLSISFLLFDKIMHDEAGNYVDIISYKSGYWIWVTSILIVLIGNIIRKYSKE